MLKEEYEIIEHLCNLCVNNVVQNVNKGADSQYTTTVCTSCKVKLPQEYKMIKCSEYLFFDKDMLTPKQIHDKTVAGMKKAKK